MQSPSSRARDAQPQASLVYHAGALGDFITTVPAFAAWRKLHPRERIVLLGKPSFARLCAGAGLFDEVWDVESGRRSFLFAFEPDPSRLSDLAAFDSALLFTGSSSALAANLTACGVRQIVRQDPLPPSGDIHVVDYHLSLFPGAALSAEDAIPRLVPPRSEDADRIRAPFGGSLVAVHPGSGSPKKNWPAERFRKLSGLIEEAGFTVVWIVGPAEEESLLPPNAAAWRNLELPVLASLLSGSRLFVGNDSGVTHLAAAVGSPVVALFGASLPGVWAPRGKRVVIMSSDSLGMEALELERVFRACQSVLEEG